MQCHLVSSAFWGARSLAACSMLHRSACCGYGCFCCAAPAKKTTTAVTSSVAAARCAACTTALAAAPASGAAASAAAMTVCAHVTLHQGTHTRTSKCICTRLVRKHADDSVSAQHQHLCVGAQRMHHRHLRLRRDDSVGTPALQVANRAARLQAVLTACFVVAHDARRLARGARARHHAAAGVHAPQLGHVRQRVLTR
jgi:hypothetical protein